METRKLDQQEIIDIVVGASDTISKKLETGAIIIPKLIAAALDFYTWLTKKNQITDAEDDTQNRDIIKEMLITEMKKRV